MSADIVSPEVRSRMMRAVGQRDTSAEMAVRRLMSALRLRYRVHNRDLPGSPDIANRRRQWAVFVNGCFWHGHKGCSKTRSGRAPRVPGNNKVYWLSKIIDNRARDARKIRALRSKGFRVLVVWECSLREPSTVAERLSRLRPL